MTLGLSFEYLGEAKMPAEQYQAARTLYSNNHGRQHPAPLRSKMGLANSKAKISTDQPDTLFRMMGLPESIADFGRHADALKVREETLALRKVKLGLDHPETLWSMHLVANSYAALGRRADALKL